MTVHLRIDASYAALIVIVIIMEDRTRKQTAKWNESDSDPLLPETNPLLMLRSHSSSVSANFSNTTNNPHPPTTSSYVECGTYLALSLGLVSSIRTLMPQDIFLACTETL